MDFRSVKKLCVQCGETLVLKSSRDVDRKRFCSKSCNATWHGEHRTEETRRKISRSMKGRRHAGHGRCGKDSPGWKGGPTTRQCKNCGSDFQVPHYRSNDSKAGKYCSKACYLSGHANGDQKLTHLIAIQCQMCGKVLDVLPHRAKVQKFCSRRCTAMRSAQVMATRTEDTWIEKQVALWLRDDGVVFDKQKGLLGMTVVDFFVEPDLVIYVDGDFWHSLAHRRRTDAYHNKMLKEAGYRVLRISESEIKDKPQSALSRLREEVCCARKIA